ncbi:MAG: class I SAM-dependent methyltransferase [Chthoniobacterales bacterium]
MSDPQHSPPIQRRFWPRRLRLRKIFQRLTGSQCRQSLSELSTPLTHRAVLEAAKRAAGNELHGDHLDIGSGTGDLLRLFAAHFPLRSFACDYTDQLMKISGQQVEIVDLNREPLPFAANRFALVTCVETIEHLENFRELIREIYRVLQPGGLAVFSTPNILNLRSRWRFLTSGFYNLFGPLALDEPSIHSTRGHINPVSWFYLAHALLSAGFQNLRLSVDKYQRRSFLAFPLLALPIYLGNRIVSYRDAQRYRTLDDRNAFLVRAINSRDLLFGRTLIVVATKPR